MSGSVTSAQEKVLLAPKRNDDTAKDVALKALAEYACGRNVL
ncbi:hypothetical protein PC116_g19178 [Phytophthora cactorum]|uniref:Uncharacterized protein n=1 Tax=Phytophthora cactorum TaxID=29920 RepID=A0A8T1BLV0_9STRA|nr:hypothetical protein PC111_g13913 [Phytophthora cactorum]KAG2817152.1 hypothetical protein PC112_g13175 [Phytophthora cactorum]KAG2852171.1 hypothetical protein PC113_g15252 [Phytophthora cactorum]KAG2892657.1 hypothetical protein PC114_g16548 [Phytophthora cactorum]KAG2905901.1 hypothetical protein PC115_g14453 [Phytophthora cactorum]